MSNVHKLHPRKIDEVMKMLNDHCHLFDSISIVAIGNDGSAVYTFRGYETAQAHPYLTVGGLEQLKKEVIENEIEE